ncbi:hypothetical protein QR680_017185 [Steinernema hermaphroditum]|uniref:Uncharacterized protein n=1 Tax=Steinernema hermaphroditum TaxID=289476 RepID=A0AA39LN75_9BILA|nr:hypothetical protein QR680_017185 [Steinernema hermaphroditum]
MIQCCRTCGNDLAVSPPGVPPLNVALQALGRDFCLRFLYRVGATLLGVKHPSAGALDQWGVEMFWILHTLGLPSVSEDVWILRQEALLEVEGTHGLS